MNFSAWSIRNPVPVLLLFALLTVMGLWAFNRLAIQNFPDMDLPTIKITAQLSGAAASQLETEVARKIEDQLASLSQLDSITTTITEGKVTMSVAFQVGKDPQTALDEVKAAVDATTNLPSEMDAPTVTKSTVADAPLVTFTAASDTMDEAELSWFVDNDLSRLLMGVQGVGEVSRLGGIDREIHVELNPDLMQSMGVTAAQVNTRLKSVQADASGGQGDVGGLTQTIRTLGGVASVEELRALPIPLPNGTSVRLDEIANVTDSYADRTSLAYLNGKPVIAAQVKRSKGYSDVEVIGAVRAAVAQYAKTHSTVKLDEAYNTVASTLKNYTASMHMIYEGAVLAIVVVWLFLRDWRATILSAVALPLSILPTFLAMYFLDFSLNGVSLLALSLVVGILVDDAIVEVENISRHMQMGKSAYDAAMEAADEIGLAVIATTFTLVAVFLPTAFMGGVIGVIFRQFGVTASVAVLASLLVARFLTPMLAAYFMRPTHHEAKDGPVMRAYMRLAQLAQTRRGLTMGAVALFVLYSVFVAGHLATGFFPAQDNAQTQVRVTSAPGSTIAMTDAHARAVQSAITDVSGVKSIFGVTGTASSGGGGGGGTTTSSVTSATIVVDLVPVTEGGRKQQSVEVDLRRALANLPGVRLQVGSGGNGTQLQITLAGSDAALLEQAATRLEGELRGLKGIGAVTSSAAQQSPEIRITPDMARMASLGVTASDLAATLRVATAGDYSANLSQLNLPERQVPIRVMLADDQRQSLDALGNLRVAGTNGTVTLDSIATLSIAGAPAEIDRLDRERNVTLTVELNGRALGEVSKEASALPAYKNLPDGVHVISAGELKRMGELFSSFGLAMAIGVFCIYAVLVLLFHDFVQPVTILAALPLSLGGALTPLVLTGTSFSMPGVIGLLMLMGIVTKNSILLVEYAIMARRGGAGRMAALMDACHKRARPIVMTTIAMAGGMLPVALNLTGGDGGFRQPMGYVVIGGLLTSTVLSLIVIPVVFTYIDDLVQFLWRIVAGRGAKDGATPVPTAH